MSEPLEMTDWPSFPPRMIGRAKPLPAIVAQLADTLGTDRALRKPLPGLSAKEVTRTQGKLNALGRRPSVPFSIETGRRMEDGVPVIYIRAIPKREKRSK